MNLSPDAKPVRVAGVGDHPDENAGLAEILISNVDYAIDQLTRARQYAEGKKFRIAYDAILRAQDGIERALSNLQE